MAKSNEIVENSDERPTLRPATTDRPWRRLWDWLLSPDDAQFEMTGLQDSETETEAEPPDSSSNRRDVISSRTSDYEKSTEVEL